MQWDRHREPLPMIPSGDRGRSVHFKCNRNAPRDGDAVRVHTILRETTDVDC